MSSFPMSDFPGSDTQAELALSIVIPVYNGAESITELVEALEALDIPGGHGKSPVSPVYAERNGDAWVIEDYRGSKHAYKDVDCSSEDETP